MHGGQGVGDGATGIVVHVDAELGFGEGGEYRLDGFGDLRGQGSTIGIAQHQTFGASVVGSAQSLDGVLRIGAPAVEEMFGVV